MSETFQARWSGGVDTKTTEITQRITLFGMAFVVHRALIGDGFVVSEPLSGARLPVPEAMDTTEEAISAAEERIKQAAAARQMDPAKFLKLRHRVMKARITKVINKAERIPV